MTSAPPVMLPQPIDDVMLAFPASVSHLMPAYDEIPDEFKDDDNPWVQFQNTWFMHGLNHEYFRYMPVEVNGERLDGNMILRHLQAIMGSFEPKHQHKEAAVAYLASQWMDALAYAKKDGDVMDLKVAGEVSVREWHDYFEQEAEK